MNRAILTIDDVASENTPAIMDYLCEKQIKPVLFAVGENVEKHYEQAVYALQKGAVIGNHSYSHPGFSSISMEECVEQIERTEEILNRLYRDAGVERKYRPFRFPYGDKGGEKHDALQELFRRKGFDKLDDTAITYPWYLAGGAHEDIDTFWTFDFAEYWIRPGAKDTKETVFERMNDRTPGVGAALFGEGNAHILLLHAHDDTERMVPEYYKLFLDYAMEQGVSFVQPEFVRASQDT